MNRLPRVLAVAAITVLGVAFSTSALAQGTGPPKFGSNTRASVQVNPDNSTGGGWNEPSGVTGSDGAQYVAFQFPSRLSRATNDRNWSDTGYTKYQNSKTDGDFGDVTLAADKAGTVFFSHINGNLEADIDYTRDGGKTWRTAFNVAQLHTQTSASPFLVDRPWIAAYSPDTDFHHTRVYMEYHDFAPSVVWVVPCSMASGSLRCGAPEPVSNPQTACNSIPGGIAVAPPGSPHAGRVYAVWSTADPLTNVSSGCNITMLAPFYSIYVAFSDHADAGVGAHWKQAPVFIGPTDQEQCTPSTIVGAPSCADVSEIFTPIAIDQGGTAYVAFVDYLDSIDKNYDVYLESSPDGTTWNGKTNGSGLPVRVDHSPGTHFFPDVVAGDAGHVAVGYIGTPISTRPFTTDDTCPSEVPPLTSCAGKAMPVPPGAPWYAYVSMSTAGISSSAFNEVRVSDRGVVIHYGDVCNLGIYCAGDQSTNRSLLDATKVFLDPKGRVCYAWTDQRQDPNLRADAEGSNAQAKQQPYDQVFTACQVSGEQLTTPSAPAPSAHRVTQLAPAGGGIPGPGIIAVIGLVTAVLIGALLALRRRPT